MKEGKVLAGLKKKRMTEGMRKEEGGANIKSIRVNAVIASLVWAIWVISST